MHRNENLKIFCVNIYGGCHKIHRILVFIYVLKYRKLFIDCMIKCHGEISFQNSPTLKEKKKKNENNFQFIVFEIICMKCPKNKLPSGILIFVCFFYSGQYIR